MPGKKYGWKHQQVRERMRRQVDAGLAVCARCGKPIIPGTSWDLGHSDADPTRYHGAEHRKCNRGHRPGKKPQPSAPFWSGPEQIGGPRPQSREW
jgi:hypothetical protein